MQQLKRIPTELELESKLKKATKIKGKPTFTSDEFSIAHAAGLVHDEGLMALKFEFDGSIENVTKN